MTCKTQPPCLALLALPCLALPCFALPSLSFFTFFFLAKGQLLVNARYTRPLPHRAVRSGFTFLSQIFQRNFNHTAPSVPHYSSNTTPIQCATTAALDVPCSAWQHAALDVLPSLTRAILYLAAPTQANMAIGVNADTLCLFSLLYAMFGITLATFPLTFWGPDSLFCYWTTW